MSDQFSRGTPRRSYRVPTASSQTVLTGKVENPFSVLSVLKVVGFYFFIFGLFFFVLKNANVLFCQTMYTTTLKICITDALGSAHSPCPVQPPIS